MNDPKCKRYKPIDKAANHDCTNCRRWTGTRCIGHETLVRENDEIKKLDIFDLMMRNNKGVMVE